MPLISGEEKKKEKRGSFSSEFDRVEMGRRNRSCKKGTQWSNGEKKEGGKTQREYCRRVEVHGGGKKKLTSRDCSEVSGILI